MSPNDTISPPTRWQRASCSPKFSNPDQLEHASEARPGAENEQLPIAGVGEHRKNMGQRGQHQADPGRLKQSKHRSRMFMQHDAKSATKMNPTNAARRPRSFMVRVPWKSHAEKRLFRNFSLGTSLGLRVKRRKLNEPVSAFHARKIKEQKITRRLRSASATLICRCRPRQRERGLGSGRAAPVGYASCAPQEAEEFRRPHAGGGASSSPSSSASRARFPRSSRGGSRSACRSVRAGGRSRRATGGDSRSPANCTPSALTKLAALFSSSQPFSTASL